jgi:hypothetical protein
MGNGPELGFAADHVNVLLEFIDFLVCFKVGLLELFCDIA